PRPIGEILRDLHENGRWEGELVQVAKDGRKLHVASHWVIRRDENIQPTAILEVNNDISSLRVVEEQRDDLLVRERRARAAAERASRLKDEFLATVSHELRTPLNAVLGWTKILLHRGSDEPDRRQALETIAHNAQKQAQLVDDLLDVSRIVSGKLRLEPTIVDLGAIVRDAAEAVTPAIWRKGISL